MDKILSARVDESVVVRIGDLAKRLGTTKKAVIEEAIRAYAERIDAEASVDVFDLTAGAWQRDESPEETVKAAREAWRKNWDRNAT